MWPSDILLKTDGTVTSPVSLGVIVSLGVSSGDKRVFLLFPGDGKGGLA